MKCPYSDMFSGMERIETHISWVFLSSEWVWKLKKPLGLGFLDFSTLEARKRACELEVTLNQRLSTGVYQGVYQLVETSEGRKLVADVEPSTAGKVVLDYAVKMQRLNTQERADVLLAAGELSVRHVQAVAARLVTFHERAQTSSEIEAFGDPRQIESNVEENFEQAGKLALGFLSDAQEARIEKYQRDFLEQRAALLQKRMRDGRIRDGHGDLRLEHIYLHPGDSGDLEINIIDCIEFNERFRYGDTCSDLSFLVMDLRHQGRADLAELLLCEYAQRTGDLGLYAVCDFYEVYRAYVRAKVDSFLASDEEAAEGPREHAATRARNYFLHALRLTEGCAEPPRLVLVSGVVGTGKSTVSRALSTQLHCPIVESDRTRKTLLGLPHTDKLPQSAYTPEVSAQVLDRMLEYSGIVVDSGRSVIVDSTFRSKDSRERFVHLAETRGLPWTLLVVEVPREVALSRLAARQDGASVSDARQEQYEACVHAWEPLSESEKEHALHIDGALEARELERLLATL